MKKYNYVSYKLDPWVRLEPSCQNGDNLMSIIRNRVIRRQELQQRSKYDNSKERTHLRSLFWRRKQFTECKRHILCSESFSISIFRFQAEFSRLCCTVSKVRPPAPTPLYIPSTCRIRRRYRRLHSSWSRDTDMLDCILTRCALKYPCPMKNWLR